MRAKDRLVLVFVIAGALSGSLLPASSADLLRHRHARAYVGGDIYADDYACPIQEPAEYKPRIENFHEPLCYAARPYGISTHLYDHPRELNDGAGSRAGY